MSRFSTKVETADGQESADVVRNIECVSSQRAMPGAIPEWIGFQEIRQTSFCSYPNSF